MESTGRVRSRIGERIIEDDPSADPERVPQPSRVGVGRRPTDDQPRGRVVHCKTELFDVYIGRPGPWGNPFQIGRDGTRRQVIDKYREWVQQQPELMDRLPELRGKILGCHCHPRPCHGDVLLELAGENIKVRSNLLEW